MSARKSYFQEYTEDEIERHVLRVSLVRFHYTFALFVWGEITNNLQFSEKQKRSIELECAYVRQWPFVFVTALVQAQICSRKLWRMMG